MTSSDCSLLMSTVYSINLRRPKTGDGLQAHRLASAGIQEHVRALGLEGQHLENALAYATERATAQRWARPLGDFLPPGLKLDEGAQDLSLHFFAPEGSLCRHMMHLTNVHVIFHHLRPARRAKPSLLWKALHQPYDVDEAEVSGSAAPFALLQEYMQSEMAKLIDPKRPPKTQGAQQALEQMAWRRGVQRRLRETGNHGFLPSRMRNTGAWFDGGETNLPENVIAFDLGSRSPMTARSFVPSMINREKVITTNKAWITRPSSRRTRTRAVKHLQSIAVNIDREAPQATDSRRIDRIHSIKYMVRASRNAHQQQGFYGAVCRGLLALLNRPVLKRDEEGELYIDPQDGEKVISPGPRAEVKREL